MIYLKITEWAGFVTTPMPLIKIFRFTLFALFYFDFDERGQNILYANVQGENQEAKGSSQDQHSTHSSRRACIRWVIFL